MRQSALLEFVSSAFATEAGEDDHTNPGVFGKALAEWLAEQLRARGLGIGEVIAEDFGWCIPVESTPHRLYVACASGEEGPHHWRVFAFAEGGLVARLFGKDQSTRSVALLFAALKEVLQRTPHVRGLREEEAP
ncbi:hypothetical protein [Rubrivivax sp. JA1026]|uniref:hypothetical protein n=1 Tax=Rubrivivax sp. JA1026 TaxID=2710888 RepID=UPI0013E987B8|nr:hypothetical protein [Rubrivivax sp. JA1026]